jgi:hypothetical protein
MTNREIEDFAIDCVLQHPLERAAGREPQDARKQQAPVDVISPPRLIEVKALDGAPAGSRSRSNNAKSMRCMRSRQPLPVRRGERDACARGTGSALGARAWTGPAVRAMVDRTQPTTSYWPPRRTGDYDKAPQLGMPIYEGPMGETGMKPLTGFCSHGRVEQRSPRLVQDFVDGRQPPKGPQRREPFA